MDIFDRAKAEETLTIGQKIRQLYDLQFDSRAWSTSKIVSAPAVIGSSSTFERAILYIAGGRWIMEIEPQPR